LTLACTYPLTHATKDGHKPHQALFMAQRLPNSQNGSFIANPAQTPDPAALLPASFYTTKTHSGHSPLPDSVTGMTPEPRGHSDPHRTFIGMQAK